MLNRISQASREFAGATLNSSSTLGVFARDMVNGCKTVFHHGFIILGVTAIGTVGLMFVRPEVTDHLKAISPFTVANAQDRASPALAINELDGLLAPGAYDSVEARRFGATKPLATTAAFADLTRKVAAPAAPAATQRQQALVTTWLAKKYRVAGDATDMLVSAAYGTAKEIKLDPLLILSVMAIESGFNPFAESPVGAQGLMQVMSKIHHEKFQRLGGIKAALNPLVNIKVGSLILKDYVTRGGSVEAGLKLYVGAAAFDTDFGYGSRVLAEYRRLKDVAVGKTVPLTTSSYVAKTKPAGRADTTPSVQVAPVEVPTPVEPSADASGKVASL